MAQNTTNNRKKSPFTLKQRAAFALATIPFDGANQATDEIFKMRIETQHFYNLVKKGSIQFDVELQEEVKKCLASIRNYTSHAFHTDLEPLSNNLQRFYWRLAERARHMILDRLGQGKKLNEDAQNFIIQNDERLFPLLQTTNINLLSQAEIAFLMAPFLGRSELDFLLGKIFFGKGAQYEKGGKTLDTPIVAAKKAVMRILSAPDNVTVRQYENSTDSWLAPKDEQAFAIYDLVKHKQDNENLNFPDHYVMKELLRFIGYHKILPDFTFARVKTLSVRAATTEQAEQFTQETTFCDNDKYPYQIKFNTIIGQNNSKGIKVTFSLRLLMHIVAYYLQSPKEDNKCEKIQQFISDRFSQYHDYSHRKVKPETDIDLDKCILERCRFWLKKSKEDFVNLQQKIRFISDKINYAWACQDDRALSKERYLEMQNLIRYYDKQALRCFVTKGLWDKTGIGLGRGDSKSLGNCITKEELNSVFKDMFKAWHDYIKGVKEGLHNKTDEEKLQIAKILGVRSRKYGERNIPCFPVGISPKDFVQEFFPKKTCENYYRSLPTIWEGAKIKDLRRGKDAEWFKSFLLIAMASHIFTKFGNKRSRAETLSDLSNYAIEINKNSDYKIMLTVGKSWRKYAKINKKTIEGLFLHYLPDVKKAPLLKADNVQDEVSVESAIKRCERERFIFIQACLRWEMEVKKRNPDKYDELLRQTKTHVPFAVLCEKFDGDDVKSLRDDALHGRVARFSNCNKPMKRIYDEIASKKKRTNNQSRRKKIK